MVRFEWRFGKLFWISLLIAFIILSNLSFTAPTVDASLPTPTKHCTGLNPLHQAGGVYMGGVYLMQQWAKVCYNNGWGHSANGRWVVDVVPHVWLKGSYETRNANGMVQQQITWHGAFRISRRKVDVGIDWIQTVDFLGVKFQRTCWLRSYVTAPDAKLGTPRGNCGAGS